MRSSPGSAGEFKDRTPSVSSLAAMTPVTAAAMSMTGTAAASLLPTAPALNPLGLPTLPTARAPTSRARTSIARNLPAIGNPDNNGAGGDDAVGASSFYSANGVNASFGPAAGLGYRLAPSPFLPGAHGPFANSR